MLKMTREMYISVMEGKNVDLPNNIKYSIIGETGYRKGEMTVYSTNLSVDFFTSIITDHSNLMISNRADGKEQQVLVISENLDKVQNINTNNNSQVSALHVDKYDERLINAIGDIMEEVTFADTSLIALVFDIGRTTDMIANVIQKIAYTYNLPCIVVNQIRQYESSQVKIDELNPLHMHSNQILYIANYVTLLYLKGDEITVQNYKQNVRINPLNAKAFQAINSVTNTVDNTDIIRFFNEEFDSFKTYSVCEKDGFTFICGNITTPIEEYDYDCIKEFTVDGDTFVLGDDDNEEPEADDAKAAFKYINIDISDPKPRCQFRNSLYLYIIKDDMIFRYINACDIVDILDDFNITDTIDANMTLNGTLSLVEDYYRVGFRTAKFNVKDYTIDSVINAFVSKAIKHIKLIANRLNIKPRETDLDILINLEHETTYEFKEMLQKLVEKRLMSIIDRNFELTPEEEKQLNIGINFMVDEGYHVPRDKWQDKMCELLDKAHIFTHGGMQCNIPVELEKYVTKEDGFENDLFKVSPYDYNADEDEAEPNFIFKPTGYAIKWYKYALRASTANKEISYEQFEDIINQCIASLPEVKEVKPEKVEVENKPDDTEEIREKLKLNSFYGKFGGFHISGDKEN